jgi:hypothetical protein
VGDIAFGDRDELGEDLHFLVDPGAAAKEDVHRLLEIEEPEGEPDVLWRQHVGAVAETPAVFVVRVDDEDAQVRTRAKNFVQHQGDAGRLADAGRTQQGEVPTDQPVNVEVSADRVVLLQLPDIDGVSTRHIEHRPQGGSAKEFGRIADGRIFLDAALEARAATVVRPDLTEQINRAGRMARCGAGRRVVERNLGEHADHQRASGPDAEEPADTEALFLCLGWWVRDLQADRGLRAGDREHAPERLRDS